MEPLGATASVVSLLEISLKTVKLVNGFIRRYREAPAEILHLKHQVEGLKAQLVLLHHVQDAVTDEDAGLVGAEAKQSLERFIEDTFPLLQSISIHFEHHSSKNGNKKRVRLKWSFQDSSRIKTWDLTLQRHSARMSDILLLLNL